MMGDTVRLASDIPCMCENANDGARILPGDADSESRRRQARRGECIRRDGPTESNGHPWCTIVVWVVGSLGLSLTLAACDWVRPAADDAGHAIERPAPPSTPAGHSEVMTPARPARPTTLQRAEAIGRVFAARVDQLRDSTPAFACQIWERLDGDSTAVRRVLRFADDRFVGDPFRGCAEQGVDLRSRAWMIDAIGNDATGLWVHVRTGYGDDSRLEVYRFTADGQTLTKIELLMWGRID